MQGDLVTERGAALEAGDIEAVVTVALLSQWFDGAPRGYLKRNINTNIMQQGVGVDSPTVNSVPLLICTSRLIPCGLALRGL